MNGISSPEKTDTAPGVAGSAGVSTAHVVLLFALLACFADRVSAGESRPPERRELWVPTRDLAGVLRQHPNAVLLDRAQYEALIRDAGKVKPGDEASKPPVDAVIEGVKVHADLIGGTQKLTIKARLSVKVLSDRWSEVRMLDLPAGVVMTRFDGSDVTLQEAAPAKGASQTVLAVHGKGRHEVAMEFQSPLQRANRIRSVMLPYLARPCSITATPGDSVEVPERWLMRDGMATIPVLSTGDAATGMSITWTERAAADAVGGAAVSQTADCLTAVNRDGVTSSIRLHLRSTSGPLPKTLKFKLSGVDANVIAVDDLDVASWKQDGATLEITRRSGFFDSGDFQITVLKPAPDGEGATPVVIEVPRLEGATRTGANLGLSVGDDFEMSGWQTPGTAPNEAFIKGGQTKKTKPGESFLTHYDVAPEKIIANIRRRGNQFSTDVDNRIALSTHDVTLERTLSLRGEEGRVNRATFTVPATEQFLGLSAASGERVEWKQLEGNSFELVWPGGLQKGQNSTLWLKSRRDLPATLTVGNDKPQTADSKTSLVIENLRFDGAIRVAGYVALEFDDSWKVATTETTGLEARDARVTPVKGRMAWFTLRDHRLALDIARNEAVLDAGVVAYALPRAKNIEIEGQAVLDVSRAPLRKFDVKLPVAGAKLLRWDSPLVGEQTLDDATGTWHLTLRKELLGTANVRFHLSLPAEQKEQNNAGNDTKNQATTLAATLPGFEFPAARRFTGAWVVEANTDTELSYETKGLQPLDALHAPVVEGYAARHRVLAVYGYGSGAHELRITATRHEPGALVTAVVNEMKLTSVLGRDGVARHEAALLVKHNGQQFFGLRLPKGADLLSARAGGEAVKPVRAGEDEVRVPLPANQSADIPVWIVVAYEQRTTPWHSSGAFKLMPPSVGEGVPVLTTSWRVFTPDGMEIRADGGPFQQVDPLERVTLLGQLGDYLDVFTPTFAKISSRAKIDFLPGGKAQVEQNIVSKPVPMESIANTANPSRYLLEKMERIIIPTVQFQGASIEEAIEFLRIKGKDLDTIERDPAKRGMNLILKQGQAPSTAQITLELKDVPMIEALRYITELAGMKYKVEPYAVVVLPVSDVATEQYTRSFKVPPDLLSRVREMPERDAKELLQANGISFPEGASVRVIPANSMLVVRNTQPNLDAVEAFLGSLNKSPGNDREKTEMRNEANKGSAEGGAISRKPGLISLELEVPTSGRVFEFRGNQRPDVITLRYQSWERQMRQSALWALLGLLLFFIAGRRRAWVRTIAVALLLTCVPLAFAPASLMVCNAVLSGWLAGFLVWLAWRIARWMEKKLGQWDMAQGAGNFATLCVIGFACFADRLQADEKPDPAAHTVIVPYDPGQPRDPQRTNRYYLDYAEFQKLWGLAKDNRRPAKPDEAEARAKPEAFINSALYDVRIEDDKLIVAARFQVLTRGAKWAKLALPFKGDGLNIAEVKLDGGTALFENGGMLIENPGAHSVEVTLQLLRSRSWKEAALEIPHAPSALMALAAPLTDGRPVFGASIASALVTEETRDGRRIFTAPLGAAKSIAFTRMPGRRLVADAPPAQADTRLLLRVLPRLEKVSAEINFSFSGTERRTLTVELDPSLRLEDVTAVPAAEATLRRDGARQFVDLRFAQTVADSAKVTISAERVFDAATGNRSAPLVHGTASRRGGVVEVQASDDLQLKSDAGGLERIAASTGAAGAEAYRVSADKTLRYAVADAEDRSRASVEAVHQFTAQKSEIIAAIVLDSGRVPLADARIGVPAGFEVQTLAGPRLQSWHREGAFLALRFDTQPDREAKVVLHLAKTIAQPAVSWKLEPLKLPQFAKHEGVAFIAVHAADDVKLAFDGADRKVREVDPASVPTVVSVAAPFELKRALRVEKADWSAEVTLTRQAPRFTADLILLARAGDVALGLSQQVGLVIEQGAVGSVKVRLPKSLPEARVHGPLVRDSQSKITGESREYEVSFQTEVLDRADVTMDFELPLEGERNLPSVQVDGASRIRRFVIVDNAGTREMKLDLGGAESAVKESLPYLPEGLMRPQFLRAGETAAVKMSFTQLESTAGNAAIITLAEITTALRPGGERWETVVYSLSNRSLQFLPVRLPAGAELIQVSVGGQTVRADRAESTNDKSQSSNSFLVPLIQMRAGELSQEVKLVYRIAGRAGIEAAHRFLQPELVGLSAERTLWNVWVPEQFAAKHFDGNMEEIGAAGGELEKLQSELSDVARLNRVLAGGNLSREETFFAWGNLNAKMEQVKKLQADNRNRLRERLYASVDEMNFDKLGKVVTRLDQQVEKQIQEQGVLLENNSGVVEQAKRQAPQSETLPGTGRILPAQGQQRESALQNWAFNKDAPGLVKSGRGQFNLNYAGSGMIDLNDNISLSAVNFFRSGYFKSPPGAISGDENVTKSGTGTITKSGSGTLAPSSGATAQQPLIANASSSNARAGQNVQVMQQAAPAAGAGGAGNLTLNGAVTVNPISGRVTAAGGTLDVSGQSQTMRGLTVSGANTYTGVTTVNAGSLVTATPANPPAPALNEFKSTTNIPAITRPNTTPPVVAADPFAASPAAASDKKAEPGIVGVKDEINGFGDTGATAQLKPVGRASLAVEVPLGGKVYHFSKLKDHALLELTVVKPLDQRQTGALWVLGIGLAVLLLVELARRGWRARRGAVAL